MVDLQSDAGPFQLCRVQHSLGLQLGQVLLYGQVAFAQVAHPPQRPLPGKGAVFVNLQQILMLQYQLIQPTLVRRTAGSVLLCVRGNGPSHYQLAAMACLQCEGREALQLRMSATPGTVREWEKRGDWLTWHCTSSSSAPPRRCTRSCTALRRHSVLASTATPSAGHHTPVTEVQQPSCAGCTCSQAFTGIVHAGRCYVM